MILQYHLFILGGIESYYYRMMKWAVTNHYRVILILDKGARIDHSWWEVFDNLGIELFFIKGVYPFYSIEGKSKEPFRLKSTDRILNISASYECFNRGEYVLRSNRVAKGNNILYIFHPYSNIISTNRMLDKYLEKSILLKLIMNSAIAYMDEETRDFAIKRYPSIRENTLPIIRLGIEIDEEIDDSELIERYVSCYGNILAIARLEFPFKAYVLGLVDAFEKLCPDYPKLQLTIIGDGNSRDLLIEKIERLDISVRERIKIIYGVEYAKLKKYIDNAYVHVGMGTTLLDCANRYVPSIIGVAYDASDISYGYWSNNWHIVGGLKNEQLTDTSTISEDLKSVLNMDKQTYIEICKKHRYCLDQHYGIEGIMTKIANREVYIDCTISKIDLMISSINYWMKIKKRRTREKIKKLLPDKIIKLIKQ